MEFGAIKRSLCALKERYPPMQTSRVVCFSAKVEPLLTSATFEYFDRPTPAVRHCFDNSPDVGGRDAIVEQHPREEDVRLTGKGY
jgi:hypothetical protein